MKQPHASKHFFVEEELVDSSSEKSAEHEPDFQPHKGGCEVYEVACNEDEDYAVKSDLPYVMREELFHETPQLSDK